MWLFSRDPVRDFPFELGPPEPGPDPQPGPAPLWKLLRGRRKADGQAVSVFVHALGGGDPEGSARARCALRRLRTLRHPNVLGYIDSLETEQCLYLVTEAVTPLRCRLRDPGGGPSEEEVAWGLHQLLTALAFLYRSGLVHGALGLDAVFVDPGGEWKLGGLERVGASGEEPPPRPPGEPPQPQDPPELSGGGKGRGEPWAGDMWRLGCLIWELFNGPLPRPGALRSFGKIPPALVAPYCELVAADPGARPGPEQLLERGRSPGGFLACGLVDTALFLQQLQVQDPPARRAFLQELPPRLETLPPPFQRHKLLPQLLDALRFGSADAAALAPLLKVAKALDPPEYQERVVPVLVRLFAAPDRALRMRLLQQLEDYIEFLPEATVSAQIFPHVAHGFLDTNPAIREQTVKSMVLLAPKLPEATRGRELPRLLCRVQGGDALGPLRCNATLCLGRLAPLLPPQVRQRVLAPALARATRDPFAPARAAAVAAFAATHGCYSAQECAGRVLPALCALTVDPDRGVREQAFRAIRSFLEKLEAAAESGGGTEGAPPSAAEPPEAGGGPGGGGLGAAVSWAVTGVTSLTARLMGAEAGTPPGPPQETPPETPAPPPQEPPPEPTPPDDFDRWDDDWGSLEDVEPPAAPPANSQDGGGGGARPGSPPSPAAPPAPPAPPPAQEGDGDEGWGAATEWGAEDAWEALPSQRAPPPNAARRQREQQRRRELEARRAERRGGAPRAPPKLGTRKLD